MIKEELIKKPSMSVPGMLMLFILVACGSGDIHAQTGDTLAVFRNFITMSSAYKQVPFYTSMEIRNSTNLVTQPDDTLVIKGEVYVKKEGAYVQFDEFEQVVGDSMALFVSNKLRQMILYRDAAPMISRMKQMIGIPIKDSSLIDWAQKYTAAASTLSGQTALITLQSRKQVYGSNLAEEMIEMRYDPKTLFPQQVLTIKRLLFPLDSLQYAELAGRPELAGKLLSPEAGRYFVIKERRQDFVYTTVEPDTQRKLPVLVTDRIVQAEGEYKPVKNYEAYRLSLN